MTPRTDVTTLPIRMGEPLARIRTVKPEFWTDDAIGALSRDARLLYIATWNLADDEGLLRWTPAYLKASVFMYDDDISTADVEAMMNEIVAQEMVFPYVAGKARQRLGYIVNFRRHQRINRPQPGKLPPPSIQSGDVLQMYIRRDKGVCHLCKSEVATEPDEPRLFPSLDHLVPRVQGGSDYPTNIALAHVSCNKSRRDRPVEDFHGSPGSRAHPDMSQSGSDSVNESLSEEGNGARSDSLWEGRGREGRSTSVLAVGELADRNARACATAPPAQPEDFLARKLIHDIPRYRTAQPWVRKRLVPLAATALAAGFGADAIAGYAVMVITEGRFKPDQHIPELRDALRRLNRDAALGTACRSCGFAPGDCPCTPDTAAADRPWTEADQAALERALEHLGVAPDELAREA